ncbi:MAG TPA: metallophosphoesterase [Caulobacteraceae bacterium]
MSDIHFGCENEAATEAALADAWAYAPSLTVVTGDLTADGRPSEFVAARAWLDRLPPPVLVTPGNHDTPYWNLILRVLTPFDRYRRHIGAPDGAVFESVGLSVHAVNTARGGQPRLNWAEGAINLAAVDAAAARLAAADGALKVFACHHPLIEIEGEPVRGGVHRGEAAARALAEARVDLILTGHLHVPYARALPFGAGCTYAVGTGTLSLRTRGVPALYSTIEATDESLCVTAMAWAGSHFEPYRTWAFARARSAGETAVPSGFSHGQA